MSDLQNSDAEMQNTAGALPGTARPAYALLDNNEVVRCAVARHAGVMEVYLFNEEAKSWEPARPQDNAKLKQGISRFEQVKRTDPKSARELEARADNTIDGHPNEPRTVEQAKPQQEPAKATPPAPPQVPKSQPSGDLLSTSTTQPRIA